MVATGYLSFSQAWVFWMCEKRFHITETLNFHLNTVTWLQGVEKTPKLDSHSNLCWHWYQILWILASELNLSKPLIIPWFLHDILIVVSIKYDLVHLQVWKHTHSNFEDGALLLKWKFTHLKKMILFVSYSANLWNRAWDLRRHSCLFRCESICIWFCLIVLSLRTHLITKWTVFLLTGRSWAIFHTGHWGFSWIVGLIFWMVLVGLEWDGRQLLGLLSWEDVSL